jgi:phosphoribosyl-ATP pyrophosphohydrolase/phosphoribosyl-AMP cyclohydrolase
MDWLSDRRPDWSSANLLPVVVVDDADGTLLMLAWANPEAVAATEATGEAHFWSRSRDELWRKGATSGNLMPMVAIGVDCDADALVYRVEPRGPACHVGTRSCFDGASYTAALLAGGPRRPAEKVTEEAGELSAAALAGTDGEVIGEAADLLYHALVLLEARGLTLGMVEAELARRHAAG